MTKVTKQQFYKALYAESSAQNDIMPTLKPITKDQYAQEWRNQKSSSAPLWGLTNKDGHFLARIVA